MAAYYNEIDPYAAQWLRNLIDAGLIAPGEVDTRSIVDVRPDDLAGFDQCHFFAGLGGWSGALRAAGVPDDRPLWTGSCPCQPFSLAGKQKGFADDRHLWPHFRDLIRERRPATVLGEQVASAAQWLGLVRGDLEAMGYAVGAIPVEAASAGADHLRDRIWFVANTNDAGSQGRQLLSERADQRLAGADGLADANGATIRDEPGRGSWTHGTGSGIDRYDSEVDMADADFGRRAPRNGTTAASRHGHSTAADGERFDGSLSDAASEQARTARQPRECGGVEWVTGYDGKARRVKSGVRLLAHGVPQRVAKLRALGNAIDLRPAAAFITAALTN